VPDYPAEEQPERGGQKPEQGEPQAQPEPQPPEQPGAAQRQEVAALPPSAGPTGEPVQVVSHAQRKRINRRELLKLVPIVAVGAFAIPTLREPLLDGDLHLSDWASGKLFGRHRLAQTYSNSDVVPFERFLYNFYDVSDPGGDLEKWTLTVQGMVERPGKYNLQ